MGASLHKLSAGSGYTYLTNQVARQDLTKTNGQVLADYYSEKGEQPGQWWGSGLQGLTGRHGIEPGDVVTEDHMKALFGEGLHPNADQVTADAIATGMDAESALKQAQLGTPFTDPDTATNPFLTGVTRAYNTWLKDNGLRRKDPIPDDVRSQIRTRVGRETFAEQYGRDPLDARELSAHITRSSRPAKTTVAGYDMTFAAPKSFSVLWAVADADERANLQRIHDDAVTETLAELETEGVFTRRGKAGVRQVRTNGLMATRFTHRDSRDGDPHLHTHVAVSNKVQDPTDGKWLTLDGQVIHKLVVPLSEAYNQRLEAKSREAGYAWTERPGSARDGKRGVREIVGVPVELQEAWSSRKAAIATKLAQLTADFTAEYHRPPTTKEAYKLSRVAHEATRQAKAEPRSMAQQHAEWLPFAQTVLDSLPTPFDGTPADLPAHAKQAGAKRELPAAEKAREKLVRRGQLTEHGVRDLAGEVVTTITDSRAVFDMSHVRSATVYKLRPLGLSEEGFATAKKRVIEAVTGTDVSMRLDAYDPVTEPADMRDGTRSVYRKKFSEQFTTTAVLDAEDSLLSAARRTGARTLDPRTVEMALLEHAANHDFALNAGQAQLVRDMATSDRFVQLALAPAGTGKTTAMSVLTRAWQDSGGTVIGLAPSAAAAEVLGESIDTDADTLAKLIHHINGGPGKTPEWINRVGPDTLVLVDEAGMAGTVDLARAVDYVTSRGGTVRLIGDDQQLAAVAAGGVLRNIASDVGALTLSEVVRFNTPGEAAATLAWRAGDTEALGFYLDRGRVVAGGEADLPDQVFTRWQQHRAGGKDALMMAREHRLVDQLNVRAREARLTELATAGDPVGPAVALRSQSEQSIEASVGDTIVTRKNQRKLRLGGTKFVKNGDRWTVQEVRSNGSIVAQHTKLGRTVTLPAEYVAKHVDLGYAATFHGAQGQTVTVGLPIITDKDDRQSTYVGITRGTDENTMFVATGGDGDEHNMLTPGHVVPPVVVETLEKVIGRDGAAISATTMLRDEHDPAHLLARSAERYADALGHAAEQAAGPQQIEELTEQAEKIVPGVSSAPAWETLRDHLLLLHFDGADPAAALAEAASSRRLDGAKDVAAVLDWRLDPSGTRTRTAGPVPWMPGVPAALADHPQYGKWLTARADQVASDADAVAASVTDVTPEQADKWQLPILDVPELHGKVAVWRAVHQVPATDTTPTGPPRLSTRERTYQDQLTTAVRTHHGANAHAPGAAYVTQLRDLEPRVLSDGHWPIVGEHLDQAAAAGRDVPALINTALGIPAHGNGPVAMPLPDEHVAAALWSRILPQLGSTTAADVITGSATGRLRTNWETALRDALPQPLPDRVMADPAWPTLVATVNTVARQTGTSPADVVTAAAGLISPDVLPQPGQDDGTGRIPLHELTHVLTWRVGDIAAAEDTEQAPDQHVAEDDFADSEMQAFLTDLAAEHDAAPDSPAAGDVDPEAAVDVEPPASGVYDNGTYPDELLDQLAPPEDYDNDQEHVGYTPGKFPADAQLPTVPETPPTAVDTNEVYAAAPAFTPSAARLEEPTAATSRERVLELNAEAARFFAAKYDGSPAQDHVRSRFGTDLTETPFAVGYAPGGWRDLTNHLRRTIKATDTELVDANLAVWNKRELLMDTFRDRAMVGIRDEEGQIVGFTGRDLTGDSPARHKNSATTPAFRKGNQVFGLWEGRQMAREAGAPRPPAVVRAEGAYDAIALTLAGRDAVGRTNDSIGVSTMGTAMTEYQADRIAAHARDGVVWAALDQDRSGYKATADTITAMAHRWVEVRAVTMPASVKDPAELWEQDVDLMRVLAGTLDTADRAIVPLAYAIAAGRADDPEHQATQTVPERVGQIIAELPTNTWPKTIEKATAEIVAANPGTDPGVDMPAHTREQLWHSTIISAVGWTEHRLTPGAAQAAARELDQVDADLTATPQPVRDSHRIARETMARVRDDIDKLLGNTPGNDEDKDVDLDRGRDHDGPSHIITP